MTNITIKTKIWLQQGEKHIFGMGSYLLLKEIEKTHSLKTSSKNLNMSYKLSKNMIKKIQNRLGEKIVETKKGGYQGGGSTTLTLKGIELIKVYEKTLQRINEAATNGNTWSN